MSIRLLMFTFFFSLGGISYTQVGNSEFIEQKFDQIYNQIIQDNQPGGCVVVLKDGVKIYQKCGGLSDIHSKEKITSETILNTGSISKTIVAYGILILDSEGKLSIEDPLIKHFPDFKHPEVIQDVKIKHLLAHNSGLPDARNVSANSNFYMTAKDKENFEPLKGINSLNFEPGARFEYSNPAFNGLALIIEKITGNSWQTFIQKRIFEPAGMTQSVITDGSYPDSGVAHAYDRKSDGWVENDYGEFTTFTAAGNGGVWCSIHDLVKYERAIQDATFIEEEYVTASRTVFQPENWSSKEAPKLGMRWFIRTYDNLQVVYHTGSQGGFRAFHCVVPEKNIQYFTLFNYPPNNFRSFIDQGLDIFKEAGWLD